jgi:hypothetical protein
MPAPSGQPSSHAEHQQDHADIGEVVGDALIGDESGRERPDHHAGEEIANERRNLQPVRNRAEAERQHQADHDGRYEGRVFDHQDSLRSTRHAIHAEVPAKA